MRFLGNVWTLIAAFAIAGAGISTLADGREYGHAITTPLEPDLVGPVRMKIRTDCQWKRPGANPHTGDTISALAALGVPEATRWRLLRRILAGHADGTASAREGRVVASDGTLFAPGFGMTFGSNILCYNTVARFEKEQSGRLYIEDGYYIWVPYVCGNVSRLLPFWESSEYSKSGRPLLVPGVPRYAQPYVPFLRRRNGEQYAVPETFGRGGLPGKSVEVNTVPEPATWLLVAPLVAWMMRSRRQA